MSEENTLAPTTSGRAPASGIAIRLRQHSPGLLRLTLYVLGPSCLIFLWHYASEAYATPRLFPGPFDTFEGFLLLMEQGELVRDITASMRRIALGFTIGALGGYVVGLAAGYVPAIHQLLYPYLHFFRFVSPSLTLFRE